MTDIELLKSAANAISMEYIDCGRLDGSGDLIETATGKTWNPLTNDGDALRLAVKLTFHIEIDKRFVRVWYTERECVELKCKPSDIDEATRRAIVRAAAEIGKQ